MNNQTKGGPATKGGRDNLPLINERIRADRVQLIDQEGKNIGVVGKRDALQRASEVGLDLVLIAESGTEGVPVTKIMDFGKSLYEKKKKQGESKKHQKVIQVKELKMRPKIGDHDYETKLKHLTEFLEEGKRVKVTLFFRGRERQSKDEQGDKFFDRLEISLADQGFSKNLVKEKDTSDLAKQGSILSRVYYLKNVKNQ